MLPANNKPKSLKLTIFYPSNMKSGEFIFLFLLFFGSVLTIGSTAIEAQTRLTVRGSGQLYPIAVPRLCLKSGTSEANRGIPLTVGRDLDISGFFKVLNPDSYIESPGKCGEEDEFAYTDWSVLGVEGLVRGVVEERDKRIKVRLFLHDVNNQKIVLGKEYEGDENQFQKIAHRFANEVMKYFTGVAGVFGSQIAYSARVGRFKELYIVDMDGSNMRQITNDRGLALSVSWHPLAENVVYTTYRNRVPNIFMQNIATKRLKQVTQGSELEMGAKFSKDGRNILASRSKGRESEIILLSLDGQVIKKLTPSNGAIDLSPDWSPDNSKIVFVSNRAGGPQIYTMSATGTNVKRISYVRSNYCTSPVWSPTGGKIAFVCRVEGRHHLFISDEQGNASEQLTVNGNNEDPTWSPDGRYLVFATTFGRGSEYNLALLRSDGSGLKQLTFSKSSNTDPAWGPLPR